MAAAAPCPGADAAPHVPVLIGPLIAAVAPVSGLWIDGTLGAGGYARALLDAGAEAVIGIDRDPEARALAAAWAAPYASRMQVVAGTFGRLDAQAAAGTAAGVVLDIGASSMQLDRPERGFSFQADGPLDMRMSRDGPSAADLVNRAPEALLADILHQYGEERAARRIARAIVAARADRPIRRTGQLAEIIAGCLPAPRPGQLHPATRSFQALRIAVNDELSELARGLHAAERVLAPGGWLAVVTFHSLEDRIVKRYLQAAGGRMARPSRHLPEAPEEVPRFTLPPGQPILPDAAEIAANPRARSAKLRLGRRTDAPAAPDLPRRLGLPRLALSGIG